MQLVLEVSGGGQAEPSSHKTFDGVGGIIGRSTTCDWIIADPKRLVSSHHGLVSYRDGQYFLTDISSNGIAVSGTSERLRKGLARLINDGDVYQLGSVDIRARLKAHVRQAFAFDATIPDDAFLGLDPLRSMDVEQQRGAYCDELDALNTAPHAVDQLEVHGTVESDHLTLPQWASPAKALPVTTVPHMQDGFWVQFGAALGTPLDTLDSPAREALAIRVAGLFRQSIEGLQQGLRTRDELNSELNPNWARPASMSNNPLKDSADPSTTVSALLGIGEPSQMSAELAVADACRDLQVHQLALAVACRAAVRSALVAFAPSHLLLCFEREGKPPRFNRDGAHWRAYQRHYERLADNDTLVGQLLRHDFSDAYAEQVRLVSTLHASFSG